MDSIAYQITSLTIVYSSVHSGTDQRKHQSSASLAFVWENSPVTGEFPAQMASNAENVSIWWRHHDNRIYRHVVEGWFDISGNMQWLYDIYLNVFDICIYCIHILFYFSYKWVVPLTYTTSTDLNWDNPIRVWMNMGDGISLFGIPNLYQIYTYSVLSNYILVFHIFFKTLYPNCTRDDTET